MFVKCTPIPEQKSQKRVQLAFKFCAQKVCYVQRSVWHYFYAYACEMNSQLGRGPSFLVASSICGKSDAQGTINRDLEELLPFPLASRTVLPKAEPCGPQKSHCASSPDLSYLLRPILSFATSGIFSRPFSIKPRAFPWACTDSLIRARLQR